MKNSPENTYLNINEAASISGKSIQTIRRAIKAKKLHVRRQKTPQGFHYFISQESLMECFRIKIPTQLKQIPVEDMSDTQTTAQTDIREKSTEKSVEKSVVEIAPEVEKKDEVLGELKENLQSLTGQYKKEREQMGSIMKDFQDRLLVMENQVRLLSAPKKKWYQFWRS